MLDAYTFPLPFALTTEFTSTLTIHSLAHYSINIPATATISNATMLLPVLTVCAPDVVYVEGLAVGPAGLD